MDTHDADVIVVGAGAGGLSAAAHLAAAGQRVLVVDRHSVMGGNTSSFVHDGFEFDVGVHVLGACEPGGELRALLDGIGVEVAMRPMDPDGYDTICFPDRRFVVPAGCDRVRTRLHESFPAERRGIDRYLDLLVTLGRQLRAIDPAAPPTRVAAQLLRSGALMAHRRRTLAQVFARLGLSPALRATLAGTAGTYCLPPSRVSMIAHAAVMTHYLETGGWYPEGGAQALGDALGAAATRHGAEILLRTTVQGIVVEDGRGAGVRIHRPSTRRGDGRGEVLHAPVVVSAADLKRTVLDLLPDGVAPRRFARRVDAYQMAPALFASYLVIDRDLAVEGMTNTNLWIHPGDDPEAWYQAVAASRFDPRPPVFVSTASLKDPGNPNLCLPGQTNLQLIAAVPSGAAFWGTDGSPGYRRADPYVARKRQVGDAVLDMAERELPGLHDAIVYEEHATPVTHQRFMRSTAGTSYGIAATRRQFLDGRPAATTPVPGLFLAGASCRTAHGIGGALISGRDAASAVLSRQRTGGRRASPKAGPVLVHGVPSRRASSSQFGASDGTD